MIRTISPQWTDQERKTVALALLEKIEAPNYACPETVHKVTGHIRSVLTHTTESLEKNRDSILKGLKEIAPEEALAEV